MYSEDSYAEIRGVRLRYRDDGHGPAVILVHGWTLDLDMWEPQTAELSPEFRIIRFDRRGFGLSSGLPSLAEDVDDLLALIHLLGLNRVALVGMSQGARVVVQIAEIHPALITGLVLDGVPRLEGTPTANEMQELPFQHYRELAQTAGMPAFREEWANNPLTRLTTADRSAHELLARMLGRYPGNDLVGDTRSPAFPPRAPALESLMVPVLLINGKNDLPSRRRAAQALAHRLPRVERAVVSAANHMCNLDNPEAYNLALKTFLERHASESTSR